jgi:hypothetical protein
MDQDERIRQLHNKARALSGGEMMSGGIENLPKDLAEQFLKRVIAFETAPTTTNLAQLASAGVQLPSPTDVPDSEVGVVLWRVIFALAALRTYLERTNHLSDRDLYAVLWHDVLREEITQLPNDVGGAWHVDVPGDSADGTNFLTYYATEDERQQWSADGPDVSLPLRLPAAYDRDDDLPAAHEENPCAEAMSWLRSRSSDSAFATNRFGATAPALKFVERLYAAGASCVMVDNIVLLEHDNGEPYSDELVVVFPCDERRRAVFDLIEHEGRPDTADGEECVIDQGRGSIRLWWD